MDSFHTVDEETFSGKQGGKLVEPFGPAGLVAVARALVEELLVRHDATSPSVMASAILGLSQYPT